MEINFTGLLTNLPGVKAATQGVAWNTVQRLMGFWVMWHLFGGLDAVLAGGMPSSSAYRNRTDFRRVFKVDVEDFLPELAAQVRAAAKPSEVA